MRILYKNFLKYSTITPSTIEAGSDVSYIKNSHLSKTFNFTGNDEYLEIDLSSAIDITAVIFDTNISSTGTVTLSAYSDAGFTTQVYSTSLDIYDGKAIAFIDEAYRYWKVVFSDPSLTKIQVKYGLFGHYIQMPGIGTGLSVRHESSSEVQLSLSGQPFSNKGYISRRFSFSFPVVTEDSITILGKVVASRKEFEDFWKSVEQTIPVYVVIYEKRMQNYPPVLGYLDSRTLKIDSIKPGVYKTSFSLRESK